jgi:Holliday junction resolvase RusA-like endonuclease
MNEAFTFFLPGPVVPKARPRVTVNGTYNPENYSAWKQDAIAYFERQWAREPLSGVTVSILLKGKHSRRGDLDNIAGAILDALVQAEILKDDNLIHVRGLTVALEWSKKIEPESHIILETK